MYRQFLTAGETATTQGPGIRMAGQDTSQRSTLTVNHGKYFIDTGVDRETQSKWVSPPEGVGLNLFQKGEIYYLFDVFAKPTTLQTYQLYVGTGFTKATDVWATTASIEKRPIRFDKIDLPAGWAFKYGTADGLPAGVLEVTMDMGFPAFKTAYDASPQAHCKPLNFCEWNTTEKPNRCRCSTKLQTQDPELYNECIKEDHRICAVWAVKDVDCPNGKCYGFGVKLGSGFDYAAGQAVRLDPKLRAKAFPANEDWSVAFEEAASDLAGSCALKPFDMETFQGVASGVGQPTKGSITLNGTFIPPITFKLADARNIALDVLLHQGEKELVSGSGANARPLPVNLVRRASPTPGWNATFVTVMTANNQEISPQAQLDIKGTDGGTFNFKLQIGTALGGVSIAQAAGCPRPNPDVELVTAFSIYGVEPPIDVGVNGKWDCTLANRYIGHK